MKTEPSLKALVDGFSEEWLKTVVAMKEAMDTKEFDALAYTRLEGVHEAGNFVSPEGNDLLNRAVDLLLKQEKLQLKLRRQTARIAFIQAFFAHLPKARTRGVISEAAIIAGARRRMREAPRHDGLYIFPIAFAPKAKVPDFHVGPIRILPKARFRREHRSALRRAWTEPEEALRSRLMKDWSGYLRGYDHVVTVDMVGYEADMAWMAAREGVEFLLNLVRMLFGFHATKEIRVGGPYARERLRSSLRIGPDGDVALSSSYGALASHLDDDWTKAFDANLFAFRNMLGSFGYWLVAGELPDNPSFERLRYANRLLAEAYSEPHDPVRLVRMTAALEALSLLDGVDKAHQLARRCANAGGWGNLDRAMEIYDAVKVAYHWRSAVVHGDAPSATNVAKAFLGLEKHLMHIYLGYLALFAGINQKVRPQSVGALRRAFKARIDLFFWDWDFAV